MGFFCPHFEYTLLAWRMGHSDLWLDGNAEEQFHCDDVVLPQLFFPLVSLPRIGGPDYANNLFYLRYICILYKSKYI